MAPSGRGCKAKGDAYERELAEYFNEHLPSGIRPEEFRRAIMSGGGGSDGTFDLTGTRVFQAVAPAQLGGPQGGVTTFELGVEAKRTERLSLWEAVAQAVKHKVAMMRRGVDTTNLVPLVITRRNRMPTEDSLVVVRLGDFVRLLRGF